MIIKEFIVKELTGDYGSGECTHFTLTKKGWNTISVINKLARILGVRPERFGYAGLKDKNALTSQRVSAWRIPASKLSKIRINNVQLSDFEENKEKIRIGSHKGNYFKIRIKELKVVKEPINVPNLFGEQRFNGTEVLGELLVKGEYDEIINKLRNNENGSYERVALKYANKGALNALRRINKRIRVLWVNAYQSSEWNKNIDLSKKTMRLKPIKEIKGMPELGSFPGYERETIMRVWDYKVNNETITFKLGKGSYATTLIKFVTNTPQKLKIRSN